jgi:predicted RND superfamily exporter protein
MIGSSNQGAIGRALESFIFGNRMLVLALFALVTAVMLFFAAQLRVDAGFKKQIPLDHEFMKTFLDYEQEFGGANRVLDRGDGQDGNMFNKTFMQTMENVTNDVIALEEVDDARVRSIFTPNVRFVEVVEDGFAGGNVIPSSFTPNARVSSRRRKSSRRSSRTSSRPASSVAWWPRTSRARWSGPT